MDITFRLEVQSNAFYMYFFTDVININNTQWS